MKKYITVPNETKRTIRKMFNCTREMVWMALNYKSDSILAKRIRKVALDRGGVIYDESNRPVEIEYLMKDSVSSGLNKIEGSATSVEQTFARASDNIKAKLREQKDTVKLVEGDLRSLEGQLNKMTPGTAWLEMKAEVEACRKVLAEEKVALADIEQQHDKAAASGKRLSRKLRVMQDEMTRMRLAGKQLTPEYAELEQKAAVLADTLGDVRAQTNVLAHDNAGLQGVISGVSGLTGAITAGVGVMGVFTKNNEDLVKVQTKVQSVLAITMGLQQMMNVLNKDSAFRLVTLRKAKDAFAAANTRLAVALGISNVAAKALMATLTLGLSVAIGVAIALWDKYRSKQAAAKEEAEEFGKKVAESAAKPISAIHELSAAWSKLGDNMEAKQKFVEENKKRFDELGISVNSVTDAENLLVANKARFVEACLARAKALAVQELAVEKYKEVLLAQQELEATPKAYVWRRGTYTDGYGAQREGRVSQKSGEWQRAEDAVTETQRQYDRLIEQQVDFTASEREILASIGAGADDIIEGSVAAIERVIASKRELLKNVTDRAEYDRIVREIGLEEQRLVAITGTKSAGGTTTKEETDRNNEIAKLRRQLAADAAEAEIDAMEDGYLKKRARADLDFEREKADIVRRQEELKALQKGLLSDEQSEQLADLARAAASKYATEVRAIDKEYFSWEAEEEAYELVDFNRELLERIHAAGIRPDDYKYADLYAEYRSLVASGEKVTYAVAALSARYGVSERQIYNLIGKFNREITYCTARAVE